MEGDPEHDGIGRSWEEYICDPMKLNFMKHSHIKGHTKAYALSARLQIARMLSLTS